MQVVQARATFVTPETFDESLTTIVARSVLEAALKEDESAELWFELGTEDGADVNRLSIDLSSTDIEQLLRLSSEDEIALTLDGEAWRAFRGAGCRGSRLEGCDRDRRDERCDPRARVARLRFRRPPSRRRSRRRSRRPHRSHRRRRRRSPVSPRGRRCPCRRRRRSRRLRSRRSAASSFSEAGSRGTSRLRGQVRRGASSRACWLDTGPYGCLGNGTGLCHRGASGAPDQPGGRCCWATAPRASA